MNMDTIGSAVVVLDAVNGLLLDSVQSRRISNLNNTKVINLKIMKDHNIIITELTRNGVDVNTLYSLDLPNCALSDLPACLANTKMKRLNLSRNHFENVPQCIKNGLRFIEHLDLSYNRLQLFEQPKCVVKLRVLHLNNNILSDIPSWIMEVCCFNLEEFYYSSNSVTQLKSSRFSKTSTYRLKKLELRNCLLRCRDVGFFKTISTLRVLDLSNEGVYNTNSFGPEALPKLFDKPRWTDCIEKLCFNNIQLSYFPDDIGKLLQLQELNMCNNELFWLSDSLGSLENLRILNVSCNKIIALPNRISELKNLEILDISHNTLTSIPDLSMMTKLIVLDIYDNCIENYNGIRINNELHEADFELNLFDTQTCCDKKYEEMKKARRLMVCKTRVNGQKENPYREESLSSDEDVTTDSEWEYNDESVVVDAYPVLNEEPWSPKIGAIENGCSTSDNEWTGSETATVCKKLKGVKLISDPDWIFEDVQM